MRFLLVDDNPIDLLIHSKVLEAVFADLQVEKKQSALEALPFLKEKPDWPDVIFLDIQMPIMDGFDLLDELIKIAQDQKLDTSIYIISSSIDPSDLSRADAHPLVSGFLQKPINIQEIKDLFSVEK